MTEYRRFNCPGATWFFTGNLAERRSNRLLTEHINKFDYRQHVDYIHLNSVKHGWMRYSKHLPHSGFHLNANRGINRKIGQPALMFRVYELGNKTIDAVRA